VIGGWTMGSFVKLERHLKELQIPSAAAEARDDNSKDFGNSSISSVPLCLGGDPEAIDGLSNLF